MEAMRESRTRTAVYIPEFTELSVVAKLSSWRSVTIN
jgi:hypothetical protein